MPVEVFIHGALCVSYSGQCLTSESLGGRSANRGQCAQACRLPYDLIVDGRTRDLGDKAYLLSPSDLAAHDLIADLAGLGVVSFKIEGRLKSAHYVAATCQTYRAAIDAAISKQDFQITTAQKHDLEQTFSRGFTHGFLSGINHQQLVAARFPKARGTRVGTVLRTTPRGVLLKIEPSAHNAALETRNPKLETLLKPGDGVVFDEGHPEQDEQGGRIFAIKRNSPDAAEIEFRDGDVNLSYINPGAIVWKTDDPAIKRRLEHSFSRETVVHRIPVDFTLIAHVGKNLELIATAQGHQATARWEEKTLESATKFPITDKIAREQLDRLGDTPFALGTLTLDSDHLAMVPKSILNDLRRQVCENLLHQREHTHEITNPNALETLRTQANPTFSSKIENQKSKIENLNLLVRTMEQLDAALAYPRAARPAMLYVEFEDVRRYPQAVQKCRDQQMPVALATLRIVKPGEQGFLKQVSDCNPDALLVRSLGAIGYYQKNAPHIPLIGDYSLNIANELTAAIFANAGITRMVPSYDLNWKQLAAMTARFNPALFECVIHQHMPMFHMEHCVFAHTLSTGTTFRDCGRPCEKHRVDLRDRVGEDHPLLPDVGCRNTLFNATPQTAAEFIPDMKSLGIHHFRIELLRESADETTRLLNHYTRLLTGIESPKETLRSLRVLNQLGVTRGTLVHE
jgi:putative protease